MVRAHGCWFFDENGHRYLDALNNWYNSEAYQAALKTGKQYATFRRYAVEGQQ